MKALWVLVSLAAIRECLTSSNLHRLPISVLVVSGDGVVVQGDGGVVSYGVFICGDRAVLGGDGVCGVGVVVTQ